MVYLSAGVGVGFFKGD